MWWHDVQSVSKRLESGETRIHSSTIVEAGAILDDSAGPIVIGARSKICAGAIVKGPVQIGSDCMIGNYAMLRGPVILGSQVRIGFQTEIKQAQLRNRVTIGPMCFVADSIVDEDAYLGAMVRTSNHRLDGAEIKVRHEDDEVATGLTKLGCWIGKGASLGIQVIILPGRVIAPGSTFEPRVTVSRNYPSGHYRVQQIVETVTERAKLKQAS